MASINSRNGKLYIDFRYHGVRCREMTTLRDNKENRKRVGKFLKQLELEIHSGDFRYEKYFPKSAKIEQFQALQAQSNSIRNHEYILFKDFSVIWLSEKQPEWRSSHQQYMSDIFRLYLRPAFGDKPVNTINKADIMQFRARLTSLGHDGKQLSASRINHIMSPLRTVLLEASDRFDFECTWKNIKPLPVPKADIKPFTLTEVMTILNAVRTDFKNYYTVRFFMGLRTGEIDGLTWDKVDFANRQLIIDQALNKKGELGPTKTRSSIRQVDMSELVYQALKAQQKISQSKSQFVFCSKTGQPLNYKNVTKRVWYPLLKFLELEKRRPYQTRHTTATLWLAAGESPEWIAKQLGHSTTTMLFNVYSRYVPNLTRQDGSAFERVLNNYK